jgi:hypothetical protein
VSRALGVAFIGCGSVADFCYVTQVCLMLASGVSGPVSSSRLDWKVALS